MTERHCYLHVGVGKAGSSAIQYALTSHHAELAKNGFLYPDAVNNFDAVLNGRPTAGNGAQINKLLHAEDVEGALQVVRSYSTRGRPHLVFSCEGFGNVSAPVFADFVDRIRGWGWTPKCLVIFRPQIDRVVSSYLQMTKAGKSRAQLRLDKFVRRMTPPNWYERAKQLEKAFGRPHLTVKWYPELRRLGTDGVPAAAFDWLGVSHLYRKTAGSTETPVINAAPSREALAVIREVNERGLGSRQFADLFLQRAADEGLPGTKVMLRADTAERIHAACLESNRRLLEEYCPNLDPDRELTLDGFEGKRADTRDENLISRLRALADGIIEQQQDISAPNENATRTTAARPRWTEWVTSIIDRTVTIPRK